MKRIIIALVIMITMSTALFAQGITDATFTDMRDKSIQVRLGTTGNVDLIGDGIHVNIKTTQRDSFVRFIQAQIELIDFAAKIGITEQRTDRVVAITVDVNTVLSATLVHTKSGEVSITWYILASTKHSFYYFNKDMLSKILTEYQKLVQLSKDNNTKLDELAKAILAAQIKVNTDS